MYTMYIKTSNINLVFFIISLLLSRKRLRFFLFNLLGYVYVLTQTLKYIMLYLIAAELLAAINHTVKL